MRLVIVPNEQHAAFIEHQIGARVAVRLAWGYGRGVRPTLTSVQETLRGEADKCHRTVEPRLHVDRERGCFADRLDQLQQRLLDHDARCVIRHEQESVLSKLDDVVCGFIGSSFRSEGGGEEDKRAHARAGRRMG